MYHVNIVVAKNPAEVGKLAADQFVAVLRVKPACVIGLATGSTPLPLYRELIEREKAGRIDFSRVRSANLDEYKGLAPDHPQSYRRFMQENLFDHVFFKPENTFVPNGCAEDLAAECREYDARVRRFGGIDLQLLGIGFDGHIGFNEPDDHFTAETHVVDLLPSTIEANSRFFSSIDEVPKQAITMGMGSIMNARKILLIANGQKKKEVLMEAMNGNITPRLPASILQLHRDVTVIFSEE